MSDDFHQNGKYVKIAKNRKALNSVLVCYTEK